MKTVDESKVPHSSPPQLPPTDWRAGCLDAMDLMRYDPEGGRVRGLALLAEAKAHSDHAAQTGAELVLAFADHYQGNFEGPAKIFERLDPELAARGDQRCLILCRFGEMVSLRAFGKLAAAYDIGHRRLLPLMSARPLREDILALNAMGIIAHESGHTEEAVGHFHAALAAARELQLPERIAHVSANLGEIFYTSCNPGDAEVILTEAREIARHTREPWILPFISTLLALTLLALEKYRAAQEIIAEYLPETAARSTPRASGGIDQPHRAFFFSVAAYTEAQQGHLGTAEDLSARAMEILEQRADRRLEAYSWWVSGHLHHRRGRYEEAITDLNRAIDRIGDRGYLTVPLAAMEELAAIYEERGEWEQAYRAHQRFHALSEQAAAQSTAVRLQTLRSKSELQQAEQARSHAEESLAERDIILDNAMVAIIFLNAQGRVKWANQAMYRMFGVERTGDHAGTSIEDFYPSHEEYYRVGAAVTQAVLSGQPFEDERQMKRADGSLFWVYTSGRAVNPRDASQGTVWALMDISKRRELEAELSRSQDHYRKVVDNAAEGIVVAQDGIVVFANERVHQLSGYPAGAMVGQPFVINIHPDDREQVVALHRRRMQGEELRSNATFRVIHSQTSQILWAEAITVTIEWEGRPASLSFMTDITERRQLEESLKRSLAERETILDNSIVGITLLTSEGRIQWANRAMTDIFGVTGMEYVGRSLERYYPSREEYMRIGAEVTAAVMDGRSFDTELPMRRDDGTPFWATLSGRAVNPVDMSQGTVWAVMDITKRRELEIALSKSEEHHRQVVNNVTECILVVQEGHIVFANPRLLELTGYDKSIFDVPFIEAIHPDDRGLVVDHHMRRLRGDKVEQHYQFRLFHKQNKETPIWVELSAVQIDWEGKPATLSFMTDITERRRLEESLKHSLEERMRLQTLHIKNELREAESARAQAEENTRAKSMFLANMSHEIRTPMNAIIGMAHLALRTELNEKQRDYVEKIHGAGVSLLGIINDILDFSKVEAGKIEMEHVEFNLERVFDNVATVTSGKAHENGLEYLVQMPTAVPRNLLGDPLRLGQVLINLVNNAIKFTERGEISISCRQRSIDSTLVTLEFEVRDTGIGMSEEQTGRLFQAFSQADESTTRKYGGTGLGLSICKGIVELMRGQIWLSSTPQAGTSVFFTARFEMAAEQPAAHVVPAVLNGIRILVVDDNPVARLILAEGLSALPFVVDTAADGASALVMIEASDADQPYGVVLTDVRMPGMDGFELNRLIKQSALLKSPPRVVLVSAYDRDEVRSIAPGARADGFLSKPVNASALYDTMLALLAPAGRVAARVAANVAIPAFRDLNVLLVEDNEINQQIAVELMEASGILVEVAANGRIALDMLSRVAENYYGAILMDVQMPEMDGHEATRRIRTDARYADIPIIAMTAHAMVEERARCTASGMDDHITKPINPAALFETLTRWCPLNAYQAVQTVEYGDTGEPLVIEGVDVEDGLSRTLGNRVFYLDMLARFREGQRYAVNEIREALHQDDYQQAERIAHTLKGVSGQLGAKGINSLAADLEKLMHEGAPQEAWSDLLDRLEHDMLALDIALAQALPDPDAQAETAPQEYTGEGDGTELLAALRALLAESDAEAVDFLQNAGGGIEQLFGSETYKRLARQVRQFDFDAALASLDEAMHESMNATTQATTQAKPKETSGGSD